MSGYASARRRRVPEWLRLTLFGVVLLALVLVPFALWGDALDVTAPRWMDAAHARWALGGIGVALLIVDVLLPIPSSVVAMGLCLSLGPFWGGVAVAIGSALSFALGYLLGLLLPQARLRAWIGPALWDRLQEHARDRALWWIVAARPLPVFAEISALVAGALRLPLRAVAAYVVAASLALGALYGGAAALGQREPGLAGLLVAMLVLPALLWCVHRIALRRLLRASVATPSEASPPSRRAA